MHFHIADVQWVYIRMSHDPLEDGSLVALVGSCDGFSLATMIRVSSGDDTENGIVISLGIFEPLEDNGTNSICSAVAAGPIIKCVAIT
jgi:hypothetical protein